MRDAADPQSARSAQPPAALPHSARQRILRATLQIVAEAGVGAVSNRRVAAAAGVSLGSLTYHFHSQEQLLRESLLLYVEEETAKRRLIAAQLTSQPLTLQQVAEIVESLAAAPSDLTSQLAELELHLHAARDPRLRDASQRCFQAHEQIATAALSALQVEDAQQHAGKVVALLSGLAVRRLASGGRDPQGTAQALVALVRGLR